MQNNDRRTKGKAAACFEELHIYQRARELTNDIYRLTRDIAFARDFGLSDQLRRAAVSILSNIAEGFERGSTVEFIQFLYIAKGSCGEVRAQLQIARDQNYVSQSDYERLYNCTRQTSGMISNFIAHLQSSAYQGEKFARPQRQAQESCARRFEEMRAAQLVNIRRREEAERNQSLNPENPSPG